jgi:Excalibur calcium-binding domain
MTWSPSPMARTQLYRANKHLDGDKDGIACEKA